LSLSLDESIGWSRVPLANRFPNGTITGLDFNIATAATRPVIIQYIHTRFETQLFKHLVCQSKRTTQKNTWSRLV
jgi:hypothetical protein